MPSASGRARVLARREPVYNCGHSITLDRLCRGASRTADRGDPTSPNDLEEKASQRKAMSDRQRSLPALVPNLSALRAYDAFLAPELAGVFPEAESAGKGVVVIHDPASRRDIL